MSIVLDQDEVEKLREATRKSCEKLKELGASSVLVICTFGEKYEDGANGHNRYHFRDGNYFEVLGAVERHRHYMLNDEANDKDD